MKITPVLVGAMLLSGCGLTYARLENPSPDTTRPAVSSTGPGAVLVGPVVITGVSDATDRRSANTDCASGVLRLTTATGEYAAVALKPGCPATTDTPQNGDHGFYPKPPATARTEQVQTPLGAATLFTNQYSECTSSCYIGGDEVALLIVDGTVVQIMATTAPASGTTSRSRAHLIALLQTLAHA